MVKRKLHVGDKVKVIGMSKITFAVKDELGTEDLFKSMIGKVYTVKGFDEYGYVDFTQSERVGAGSNRNS
jgi:hypothetical protein